MYEFFLVQAFLRWRLPPVVFKKEVEMRTTDYTNNIHDHEIKIANFFTKAKYYIVLAYLLFKERTANRRET